MEWRGYKLSKYTSEDVDGIVEVLSFLWENDEASNKEYFIWKHQRNPFLKKPVSVVAKHDGKVVAFWGFLPNEWRIGSEKINILISCDTIIHLGYRGKGLYSGMLKLIMREYCNEYKFFACFTANHLFIPPALHSGWKPLFPRKYLRHLNMLNLAGARILGSSRTMLDYGNFGDIEVSDINRPADISRIDGSRAHKQEKFSLNKSPDFVAWRSSDKRARYVYFYHLSESGIDAYVILSRRNHAHVIDYGEEEGSGGIRKLFDFIVDRSRFSSISFLTASIQENLEVFLRSKHFYAFDWMEKRIRKESYSLPILIRPTVENYSESNWFVNGVDLRDVNNWHITEICFD